MKPTEFKCDQCEKFFTEDQMTTTEADQERTWPMYPTSTGGGEIYCQACWLEKDKLYNTFQVKFIQCFKGDNT